MKIRLSIVVLFGILAYASAQGPPGDDKPTEESVVGDSPDMEVTVEVALQCLNGATKVETEGIEQCQCFDGFTGFYCEFEMSVGCVEDFCMNGGQCYVFGETIPTCVCKEGFRGLRCEMEDESIKCPELATGDIPFLPTCTLETTLGKAASCVNYNIPFLGEDGDLNMCRRKLSNVVYCLYNLLGDCSGTECPSLWDIDGSTDFYLEVANSLFNFDSEFFGKMVDVFCTAKTPEVDLPNVNMTSADFGAEMCGKGVLQTVMDLVIASKNADIHKMPASLKCPRLAGLRESIYKSLSECDFSKVGTILPEKMMNNTAVYQGIFVKSLELFNEWVIPECKEFECRGIDCFNDGKCIRNEYGLEYCECAEGFGGIDCSNKRGNCSEQTCSGNGLCIPSEDNYICVCYPGFDGYDCERVNETRKCAMPQDEDDAILFPACSLKGWLSEASECINMQLPYITPEGDRVGCTTKMVSTVHCMTKVLSRCSSLACNNTIWDIPAFNDFFADTVTPNLYNASSQFMTYLYEHIVCPEFVNSTFIFPNVTLNVGDPVCKDTLIDNLADILKQGGIRLHQQPAEACGILDRTKVSIFNETKRSCNWTKIADVLPEGAEMYAPYFEELLGKAQKFFLQWVIPSCRNPCYQHNPCMNDAYCDGSSGYTFCVCKEGWNGENCDIPDTTARCPVPADDDYYFLPKCTIKSTAGRLMRCFDGMDEFIMKKLTNQIDMQECSLGVYHAMQCMGETLTDCSRLDCPMSIYLFEGVPEIMSAIISAMYHPEVIHAVSSAVCSPQMDDGTDLMKMFEHFNINIPKDFLGQMCSSDLIADLQNALKGFEMDVMSVTDMEGICGALGSAQSRIVGSMMSCNFGMLEQHFPGVGEHLVKAIEAVRGMMRDWEIPFCQGAGGEMDGCPAISQYGSSCERQSAYMCRHVQYHKNMLEWSKVFMEWWQGCSNFAERDWFDWADHMNMRRGDGMFTQRQQGMESDKEQQMQGDDGKGQWSQGDKRGFGMEGFNMVMKENFDCPQQPYFSCRDGGRKKSMTVLMGCRIAFCDNQKYAGVGNLDNIWMMDLMVHEKLMKIFKTLSNDCSRSSASCGSDMGQMFSAPPPQM